MKRILVSNPLGHDVGAFSSMNPLIARHYRQILLVLWFLIFGPGLAQAITVKELRVDPNKIVNITTIIYGPSPPHPWTGNVYAGVNKLLVDGVPMDGFCIDPFHFSLGSSDGYSFVPLTSAPKFPGTMTAWDATLIGRLWGSYYSPTMTAADAAGLQIAIWEIVGGSSFQLNGADYGAGGFLAYVSASGYSGPRAHLIGLTGPGQDYVVAAIPDGGTTLGMLGLAFILVSIARWWGTRRQALAVGKTFASGSAL
jgi:hypothetical protein